MSRFVFLAAPIVLGLVACGGGSPATTSAAPTPTPIPTSRSLTLDIHPMGDNTAHGTVVIDIQGDGYTMTVTVLGLTPNSRHRLNMHGGSCARPVIDSSEVVPVGEVQADATGQGTFTSLLLTHPYVVPTGGRILTVHNEPVKDLPGETPVPFGHIACADLTN